MDEFEDFSALMNEVFTRQTMHPVARYVLSGAHAGRRIVSLANATGCDFFVLLDDFTVLRLRVPTKAEVEAQWEADGDEEVRRAEQAAGGTQPYVPPSARGSAVEPALLDCLSPTLVHTASAPLPTTLTAAAGTPVGGSNIVDSTRVSRWWVFLRRNGDEELVLSYAHLPASEDGVPQWYDDVVLPPPPKSRYRVATTAEGSVTSLDVVDGIALACIGGILTIVDLCDGTVRRTVNLFEAVPQLRYLLYLALRKDTDPRATLKVCAAGDSALAVWLSIQEQKPNEYDDGAKVLDLGASRNHVLLLDCVGCTTALDDPAKWPQPPAPPTPPPAAPETKKHRTEEASSSEDVAEDFDDDCYYRARPTLRRHRFEEDEVVHGGDCDAVNPGHDVDLTRLWFTAAPGVARAAPSYAALVSRWCRGRRLNRALNQTGHVDALQEREADAQEERAIARQAEGEDTDAEGASETHGSSAGSSRPTSPVGA